jgi:hypothetical protein
MARMKLGDLPEAHQVEMWGTFYNVRPLTRSVQKKVIEFAKNTEHLAESDDNDEVAEAIIAYIDLRLENTNGSTSKPGTVVRKKWKAEEVTIAQLEEFVGSLDETDDPT